ncbi:GTP cyclohydrolase II [Rhizobium sp. CF142]|uniref:GTP cyclohydrolase II n=1 Tax=Rhizobium sp. CF142 TaxID=1144314 RepID=UPI0012F68BA3|nr:GTP cyclohydrolase II [Rhizobium sp. CF142]
MSDPKAQQHPSEPGVARIASSRMPTTYGAFTAIAYREHATGFEHIVLIKGNPPFGDVLVRVHSECLTGEAFGSLRCDCAQQLEGSLRLIAASDAGCLIYLRGHEGRGIGLANKIAAYGLQDEGLDTLEANVALGLPADARDFAASAGILEDLGIDRVVLFTNSPQKAEALRGCGVAVTATRNLIVLETADNAAYLRVREEQLSHIVTLTR